jgi:DNA polymerase III subunit beta
MILNYILLKVVDDKLVLIATDLNIRETVVIPATVEAEGTTTVHGKKFSDIVKSLKGDDVFIELEEQLNIKSGKAKIKLNVLTPEDFPSPPEIKPTANITVQADTLIDSLKKVDHAISKDETRKALSGVLLRVEDGKLITVGTDGRKLAVSEKYTDSKESDEVILPIGLLSYINRLTGDVNVAFADEHVIFKTEDTAIISKIIDETYPSFEQVIPDKFTREVKIDTNALADIIKRASYVISTKRYCVNIQLSEDKLAVDSQSTEFGSFDDSMDIENGYEHSMSLNPDYLLPALNVAGVNEIAIKFNEGYSPFAVSNNEDFTFVLMPMRRK